MVSNEFLLSPFSFGITDACHLKRTAILAKMTKLTLEMLSARDYTRKESHVDNDHVNSISTLLDANDVKSHDGSPTEPPETLSANSSIVQSVQIIRAPLNQSEAKLKTSNSWLANGDHDGDSRKSNVLLRPESPRLLDGTNDDRLSNKGTGRSRSGKSKARKKKSPPSTVSERATIGVEALSCQGTWRPLITNETHITSRRTAKSIAKEAANATMVENGPMIARSEDKTQQPIERGENCCENRCLENHISTIETPEPNHSQDAQSLASLFPSRTKRGQVGHKDKERSGSPKKDDTSISEHRPKSSCKTRGSRRVSASQLSQSDQQNLRVMPDAELASAVPESDEFASTRKMGSPASDKIGESEHAISKPEQAPEEQRKNREDRKKNRTRTGRKGVRRPLSHDSLTQSPVKCMPSRLRRHTHQSSWGDLTLEGELDLEEGFSKRNKSWNAPCSLDSSQRILMEELLSAHPEKEGSKRKEKLKHAFVALKKKITGARKDSSETSPSITMEDSCRNFVSLCDDSHQQNFGSANNIDLGMHEQLKNTRCIGIARLQPHPRTRISSPTS